MVSSWSPSLPRRLLPFAVFLTAFAVVMVILLMSIDMKGMKHRHVFNFSQDLYFHNVAQDNPQFIAYIRAVHLKLPPAFKKVAQDTPVSIEPLPQTELVAKLLNYKKNGVFVEAGAYRHGKPSDTEWLELVFGWRGLLIQPDPWDFLILQQKHRTKALSIHACLSPTPYPKEVTFRQVPVKEMSGTQQPVFTRVKCFPIFSLLKAANMTTVDYLSIHPEGAELQVLKTLPFERVKIRILSIERYATNDETSFMAFMMDHKYSLVEILESCYIFKLNAD